MRTAGKTFALFSVSNANRCKIALALSSQSSQPSTIDHNTPLLVLDYHRHHLLVTMTVNGKSRDAASHRYHCPGLSLQGLLFVLFGFCLLLNTNLLYRTCATNVGTEQDNKAIFSHIAHVRKLKQDENQDDGHQEPNDPVVDTSSNDNDNDTNDEEDSGLVGPVDLSRVLHFAKDCFENYKDIMHDWEDENLIREPYYKSPFAYTEACRKMALHHSLVNKARELIGTDDIMLASMSPLEKKPGWQHRWHSDMESVVDPSCTNDTWTAWIPAWGGSSDSGLHFITHTSNSKKLAQTYLIENGQEQCKVCEEEDRDNNKFDQAGDSLLKFAQETNKRSQLVRVPSNSGQAWFFKGTTFHGSVNRSDKTRVAFQFHFMPAKCRFRRHDSSSDFPQEKDLSLEMPLVIPIMGEYSDSVMAIPGSTAANGDYEPFPFNNWLLPDLRIPQRLYAMFDRTQDLQRITSDEDPMTDPEVFELKDEWANAPCTKHGKPAAKCKLAMMDNDSRTQQLRHVEYHVTKLRANVSSHSFRTHEDYELLYLVSGKGVISLTQPGEHEHAVYRKEMLPGELAFYPAWQPHGIASLDEPIVYFAIRWMALTGEKPHKSSYNIWWEGLDAPESESISEYDLAPSQSLNVTIHTVTSGKTRIDSESSDTLILVTRGSIIFGETTIQSPGTLFLPKTSATNDVDVAKDSRMVVVQMKPKGKNWDANVRDKWFDDLHYGMPVAANRKHKGVFYPGIVTSSDREKDLVTVLYDDTQKFETLDEEEVYFPGDQGMFASKHKSKAKKSFNSSLSETSWTVVLTANAAYEEILLNWLHRCEIVGFCRNTTSRGISDKGGVEVILYAQDQALYDKYKNSPKLVVKKAWETGTSLVDSSKTERQVDFVNYAGFTHIVSQRPAILLDAMKNAGSTGSNLFLYADLDVLLVKDPRPSLHSTVSKGQLDMSAGHCGRSRIKACPYNTGFVVFRDTAPVRGLFSEWKLALENRKYTIYNQAVFNNLIRTESETRGRLKHGALPLNEYPTGKQVNSTDHLMGVIAFHNNFCNQKVNSCVKQQKAEQLGLWHPLKYEEMV